jgi:multidrug efflux system membrane fusion protein
MTAANESTSERSKQRWHRSPSLSGAILRLPGLPLVILALGGLAAWAVVSTRPPPAKSSALVGLPEVSVVEIAPRDLVVRLRSPGTIEAARQIDLAAEVSGVVAYVAPELEAGGRFEEGDLLVSLNREESEIALRRASAALDLARVEQRQVDARRRRLDALADDGVESSARREDATFAAGIAAARVRQASAERDAAARQLAQTELRAPFDGRVRAGRVHAGQFIERGQSLVRILASGEFEVRLPLRQADLAHLELDAAEPPRAHLRSAEGRVWAGRIVRLEAALSERTHMAELRVRLEPGPHPPPVGEFVHAEIEGRVLRGVTPLPRSALAEDARVLVVNAEGRVEARPVEVIRVEGDAVWIGEDRAAGTLVVVPARPSLLGQSVDPSRPRPASAESTGPETTP